MGTGTIPRQKVPGRVVRLLDLFLSKTIEGGSAKNSWGACLLGGAGLAKAVVAYSQRGFPSGGFSMGGGQFVLFVAPRGACFSGARRPAGRSGLVDGLNPYYVGPGRGERPSR